MSTYAFTAEGEPTSQGSMSAFEDRRGKIRVVHQKSAKLSAWRNAIRAAAIDAGIQPAPTGTPVTIDIRFMMPRPKRPEYSYPQLDLDKLARAVLDALSPPRRGMEVLPPGCAWADDSQVAHVTASKEYATSILHGADVQIWW
ncbi:MAG: RusA family crossover junction endodeoxyribonuclease [Dehalococcoidia bacterium]